MSTQWPPPTEPGGAPADSRPAPRHRQVATWLLVLLAAAGLGLLSRTALLGSGLVPVGVLSTAGGPPGVSSKATTPAKPSDPQSVLRDNPIDKLTFTTTCPSQAIPGGWKRFQTQVAGLVACENRAWAAKLAGTSISFSKPAVHFYSDTVKSPCGKLGSSFPASYCTANQTLYFSRAAYQQGRYYRLSVAAFVFHEYAHHVQQMAGIFDAYPTLKMPEASASRRIELQAHCIAHYWLVHAGVGFGAADRRDVEYQLGYTTDANGHGSVAAQQYWGHRGLRGKTIGACDTWSAPASKVK